MQRDAALRAHHCQLCGHWVIAATITTCGSAPGGSQHESHHATSAVLVCDDAVCRTVYVLCAEIGRGTAGQHATLPSLFLVVRFFIAGLFAVVASLLSLGALAAMVWLAATNSTTFEATQRARRYGWYAVVVRNAGNMFKTSVHNALTMAYGTHFWLLPVPPVGNGDGTQWRMAGV